MNKMSRFAVCVATVIMIAFVPVRMVWSADDSASVAQVYLEFDPATGEFKSVPATAANSPDGSMTSHKGNHAAQTDTQNTSQSTPAPAQTASTPAADASGAAQGNGPSPVVIGAIVALVVVGGVVLTLRKKTA